MSFFDDLDKQYAALTGGKKQDGPFKRGVKQSVEEMKGIGYGAVGLAGGLAGIDRVKDWGLENAQEHFDKSAAMGESTDDVDNIESFGDFAQWLKHGAGYVGTQAIPAVVSGGVGAIVGKELVKRGIKREVADQVAKELVAKGAKRGAIAGAGASSYAQEAGSIYPDMVEEGHDDPGRAAAYAVPAALLDVLPEARIAGKIFGGAADAAKAARPRPGLIRTIATEGGKQAGIEALTETGQTAIERAAAYKAIDSPEAMSEYRNAAALGALGGGMIGGITAPLGRAPVDLSDRSKETSLIDTPTDTPPAAPPAGIDPYAIEQEFASRQPGLFTEEEAPTPHIGPLPQVGQQGQLFTEVGPRGPDTPGTPPPAGGAPAAPAPVENPRLPVIGAVREAMIGALAEMGTTEPNPGQVTRAVTRIVGDASSIPEVLERLSMDIASLQATKKRDNMARAETLSLVRDKLGGAPQAAVITPTPSPLQAPAPTAPVAPTEAPAAVPPAEPAPTAPVVTPTAPTTTGPRVWRRNKPPAPLPPLEQAEPTAQPLGGQAEEIVDLVVKTQGKNGPRNKEILMSHLVDGVPLPELAKKYGMREDSLKDLKAQFEARAKTLAGMRGIGPETIKATRNQLPAQVPSSVNEEVAAELDTVAPVGGSMMGADAQVGALEDADAAVQFEAGTAMHTASGTGGIEAGMATDSRWDQALAKHKGDVSKLEDVHLNDMAEAVLEKEQDPVKRNETLKQIAAEWKRRETKRRGQRASDGVVDEEVDELDFNEDQQETSDVDETAVPDQQDESSPVRQETVRPAEGQAAVPAKEGKKRVLRKGAATAPAETKPSSEGKVPDAPAKAAAKPQDTTEVEVRPDGTKIIRGAAAQQFAFEALTPKTEVTEPKVVKTEAPVERALPEEATTRRDEIEAKRKEFEQRHAAEVAAEEAKKDRPTREPRPAKPKREAPIEISTSMVDAEKAWTALAKLAPLPTWADVPFKLRKEFADYGSNNWALADAVRLLESKGGVQRSENQQDMFPMERLQAAFDRAGQIVRTSDNATLKKLYAAYKGLLPTMQKAYASQPNSSVRDRQAMVMAEMLESAMAGERVGSENPTPGGSSRVEAIRESLREFIGFLNPGKVQVVQEAEEIPRSIRAAVEKTGPITRKTQAFVYNGKAWLIAAHIPPGTERAVFMHEVGSHLGLEGALSETEFDLLVDKLNEWADRKDNSLESRLAVRALQRVWSANVQGSFANTEYVAYFIEEAINAGVEPTLDQKTEIGKWLSRVWLAFSKALKKLGFNFKNVTAQDVIDLAYGAARFEMVSRDHGVLGTQRSFVGRDAVQAQTPERVANLAAARMMEANSAPPAQIWTETGWFKGPDGQWRMELSDKDASLNTPFKELAAAYKPDVQPLPLQDVLDHPELYAAYPELKKVKVTFRSAFLDMFQSTQGWYNDDSNTINITPYAQEPLSTLLHEVQHWIQNREGFARGGNQDAVNLADPKIVERLERGIKDKLAMLDNKSGEKGELSFEAKKTQDLLDALPKLQGIAGELSRIEKAIASTKQREANVDKAREARIEYLGEKWKKDNAENNKKRDAWLAAERKVWNALWDRMWKEKDPEKRAALKKQIDDRNVYAEANEKFPMLPFPDYSQVYADYREITNAILDERKALAAERDKLLDGLGLGVVSDLKFQAYQLISGEVEARDTQGRLKFSDIERKLILPGSTDNYDFESQIVDMKPGTPSASVESDQFMGQSIYDSSYRKGRLTEKDVLELPERKQNIARDWIKFNDEGNPEGFYQKHPIFQDSMVVKNSLGGHFLEGLHKDEYARKEAILDKRRADREAAEEAAVRRAAQENAESQRARNARLDAEQAATMYAKHLGMSMQEMFEAYRQGDRARLKALYDRVGTALRAIEGSQVQRSERMDSVINQLPKPAQSAMRTVATTLKDWSTKFMLAGAITEDIADMTAKNLPSVGKYIEAQKARQATRLEHEQAIDRILKMYEHLPHQEKGMGPLSVNAFIFDSTMQRKWGYKLDESSDFEPDPEFAARFNRLSAQGQALVKATFKHGNDTLRQKQEGVRSRIQYEFGVLIEQATDGKEKARLERDRALMLSRYNSLMDIGGNFPYAPIKRFGEYVTIGMSKAYADARANNDTAELTKLEKMPNHYWVSFHETLAEADAKRREIASQYESVGGHAVASQREAAEQWASADTFVAFDKMRRLLKNQLGDKASTKDMDSLLNSMYLLALSEASARKNEMHRRGIAGGDKDMMRALATQGRADAHFISTLKHHQPVEDALDSMRKEVKDKDRQNDIRYFNELLIRHQESMHTGHHRTEDAIKRATSIWMLSTSPAFYAQQLSQTYVVTQPLLAAKHGYYKSGKAIWKAYGEVFDALEGGKFNPEKIPADVRDMLKTLTDHGKIDIGIDIELGSWATANANTPFKSAWNKTDGFLRSTVMWVETYNRSTAAIAAYRMEKARLQAEGKSFEEAHAAATKYAEKIVHMTHGSYDGFNTPRLLSTAFPGARVITQFRRYQIIQLALIARLFHGAFKGATREEKLVARKALGYTLGHAFTFVGALGTPVVSSLATIAMWMFGDDDDPEAKKLFPNAGDKELFFRKAIGDQDIADLLLKGAPASFGMDWSQKIGWQNMTALMPFTDADPFSRKGFQETVYGLLGPAFSLGAKTADGIGLMGRGEYYKGMEALLPNGFANAMKGYRFADEGITMRNGDVVLPPEEVTLVDGLMQGLGFPSGAISRRNFVQSAKFEYDTYFKDQAGRVRGDYLRAYREGDAEGMAEARDAWMKLQDARVANGYKRDPLSSLLKAPQEQRKRERTAVGGVQFNSRQKGLATLLEGL